MTALGRTAQGLRTFASDIAQGFFEITHNSFALVGVAVVFSLITLSARPDLRQLGESRLMSWLHQRQTATLGLEPELDAIDRATATNPKDLPKQQAAIAFWLIRGDFDPSWWIPNLYLMIYPLFFLQRFVKLEVRP